MLKYLNSVIFLKFVQKLEIFLTLCTITSLYWWEWCLFKLTIVCLSIIRDWFNYEICLIEMVEVEVIRQQYPAVMWRFSLVIEECGIIQLPALSLLHTHCVIQFSALSLLHTPCVLCCICVLVKVLTKKIVFGIASFLFGWLELRTSLLKESAVSLFLLYVIHRGRFFSFHLWSSSLYINYLLFIKKFFGCTVWLVGSCFMTRDSIQAFCSGSMES